MRDDEFKEFMREITLRHERATRNFEAWLREESKLTKEMIRKGEEISVELRDLRDEAQAQRAALWQILDRLGEGGAPPATA